MYSHTSHTVESRNSPTVTVAKRSERPLGNNRSTVIELKVVTVRQSQYQNGQNCHLGHNHPTVLTDTVVSLNSHTVTIAKEPNGHTGGTVLFSLDILKGTVRRDERGVSSGIN